MIMMESTVTRSRWQTDDDEAAGRVSNVVAIARSSSTIRLAPVGSSDKHAGDVSYVRDRRGRDMWTCGTGKDTTSAKLAGKISRMDRGSMIVEFYDSRGSKVASL